MGRGGKRKGAGRKSNADIARARELIGAVIPEKRWKTILESLAALAASGSGRASVDAFRVLATYAFGVPSEKNSPAEAEKEISVIRIIDPGEKYHDPNAQEAVSQ